MSFSSSMMFGCFFCGVDSRSLLYFFIIFVACLVLAALFFLIWAINRGDFKRVEGPKYEIFDDPETDLPGAITTEPLTVRNHEN